MEVKEEQMTQVEGAATGKPGKEKKPLNVKKEILSWILTIAVAARFWVIPSTATTPPTASCGSSIRRSARGSCAFLRKSATRGLRISPGGYSTPRSRGITSRFWTVR